jgi:hypothetical protein
LAKIVKSKKRILGFPKTEDDSQNADEIMPKENNISTNSNLFWNPRGLGFSLVSCVLLVSKCLPRVLSMLWDIQGELRGLQKVYLKG